jgi:2-phosphosulfolactate phosphatase
MVERDGVTVDVAFTPHEALRWRGRVCVVVDQLRASSTIVTLLDGGCVAVIPVAGLAEGRAEARAHGYVLAGEQGGLRPPGYDYGNSPAELARAPLGMATVMLRTRNGTRVARQMSSAEVLLIGCLLNVTACSELALARSEAMGAAIGIVCAGRYGSFALDDALAAGALVDRLCTLADEECVQLTDAAMAARHVWDQYPDPLTALRVSSSGRLLNSLGLDEDIEICARVDASQAVPILQAGPPLQFVLAAGWDHSRNETSRYG